MKESADHALLQRSISPVLHPAQALDDTTVAPHFPVSTYRAQLVHEALLDVETHGRHASEQNKRLVSQLYNSPHSAEHPSIDAVHSNSRPYSQPEGQMSSEDCVKMLGELESAFVLLCTGYTFCVATSFV